eukprot:7350266-Lingulodinium_polyedra.AAC.1
MLDANDRMGFTKVDSLRESKAIGTVQREKEGYSGTWLRRVLHDQEMCAVNTYHNAGPTFFGTKYCSRIDYVCTDQRRMGS